MSAWLRRVLTKRRVLTAEGGSGRRIRVLEEPPSERFVVSIALMIVFFAGLIALEIVHMLVIGEWSDVIFNGVMLVVGSLVGALFGWGEA